MSARRCDNCGTPLRGRKGHGFVVGRKLVCGRAKQRRTVRGSNGEKSLLLVPSPGCEWR